MGTMAPMMNKLAASPVKAERALAVRRIMNQGGFELGEELQDQRLFALPVDKVGAESGQAESRLCTAQSVSSCGQLFQERCDGQLPERGLRFDGG